MNINGYEEYLNEPNTICEGAKVFTKYFCFDTNNEYKNRLVRVYIPSNYDFNNPNRRFKTLYMLDGKNLFDDYTSFVGEWGIDESIENLIRNGNEGYIVIGIDAPNTDIDRSLEMSPDGLKRNKKYPYYGLEAYASKLGDFIFKVVKPDIDKTFYTKKEKEYTGVGGSSMGGIMAFYLGLNYKHNIKYCLNFSPAFFLFDWKDFKKYVDERFSKDLPNMYFYIGGKGFEKVFVETTLRTYNYFLDRGYSHRRVMLLFDSNKEHNESAWREYFPIALTSIDN